MILERQAKDHLPDGEYYIPTEKMVKSMDNITPTNIASERDFAMLDYLAYMKPAATVGHIETIVMWSNNKTSQYLSGLSLEERAKMFSEVSKCGPMIQKKWREKHEELFQKKLERLQKKQEEKEKMDERSETKRWKIMNDVMSMGGLWKKNEISEKMQECVSDAQKKERIYAQIYFLKDIMLCNGKRELFQKSHLGKRYDLKDMVDNLKVIHEENDVEEKQSEDVEPRGLEYRPISEVKEKLSQQSLHVIEISCR